MDFYVNTSKLYNKMVRCISSIIDTLNNGATVEEVKGKIEDFMNLSDVYSENYCHAMIKTGEAAGTYCSARTRDGEVFCVRHFKGERKKSKEVNVEEKILLASGRVVNKKKSQKRDLVMEMLKKNKKTSLKEEFKDGTRSGRYFTRSGGCYLNRELRDCRSNTELAEAGAMGYIVDKIALGEDISNSEILSLITSYNWKCVTKKTVKRGTEDVSYRFEKGTREGQKVLEKLYEFNAMMNKVLDSQEEEKRTRCEARSTAKKVENEILSRNTAQLEELRKICKIEAAELYKKRR